MYTLITDSDSGYNLPRFEVATYIGRDSLGTSLRVGDKLTEVNGKPTHEMWTQRVDGVLRLSFEEKRKKRKPKPENVPNPKIVLAVKEDDKGQFIKQADFFCKFRILDKMKFELKISLFHCFQEKCFGNNIVTHKNWSN